MTNEQESQAGSRKIDTGGGAYVEGSVDTGGGEFVGRDKTVYGGDSAAIAQAFDKIYKALDEHRDGPEKTMASQAIAGLEEEAKKGEEANEGNVAKWFNFLKTTLPDLAEVVVRTFINPIDGLSTAFSKIAQKAQTGS